MRVIFLAQLFLSASLKITDQDEPVTLQDNIAFHQREMTPEARQAHLQNVRLQMQRAFDKESKTSNSLIQLKAMKNAASKSDTQSSLKQMSTTELKQELAAGELMAEQAQRMELMNKIAEYKVQVDYQVALEKKVNEILLEKATKRAADLMQLTVHQLTLTDRMELGLLSEAELKQYAAIEARMNEYLKEHEPEQVAAKEALTQIYGEVLENIRTNPHALQRAVSLEDMNYLIDTFGGDTLKQAKKEVSMMQISKEDPLEFADNLLEAFSEPQVANVFNKKMAASRAA